MQGEKMTMLDTALCQCGDDMRMLEYVYNETYSKVFSVCYSVLRQDAASQDAAHDTYIRLMKIYKKYKKGTNPLNFILKVAVNVARDREKSGRRFTSVEDEIEKGDEGREMDRIISDIYTDRLLRCLNEDQRLIVMLYVYSGLTFEEIAQVVGTHTNTVRRRYKKALDILEKEVTTGEK